MKLQNYEIRDIITESKKVERNKYKALAYLINQETSFKHNEIEFQIDWYNYDKGIITFTNKVSFIGKGFFRFGITLDILQHWNNIIDRESVENAFENSGYGSEVKFNKGKLNDLIIEIRANLLIYFLYSFDKDYAKFNKECNERKIKSELKRIENITKARPRFLELTEYLRSENISYSFDEDGGWFRVVLNLKPLNDSEKIVLYVEEDMIWPRETNYCGREVNGRVSQTWKTIRGVKTLIEKIKNN